MPKCPRDKKLNYDIKFCREMVKSNARPWCKDCLVVVKPKKVKKK